MKNTWSSSYNCIVCRCPRVGSEGLQQSVWEEARGYPVVDTQFQPFRNGITAEPLSHVRGTSVKTYLRKGREHQKRSEQQREWQNNKVRGRERWEERKDSPRWNRYAAKGIAAWGVATNRIKWKEKQGAAKKPAAPWLKPPPPFASLKGLSVPYNGNKQGGELSGVKLSMGNEEGWFSPSVLMFAFFCFPVIEYLC